MFGIEFVPETTSFLLLVVLALVSLWWLSTRRPAGLPPGPGFALPVLGHMHLLKLKSDPRQLFAAWRRQYGDVFSLYVGSRLVVVLNGYKVIKRRWSNKLTSSPTDRTFLLYKFLISEVFSTLLVLCGKLSGRRPWRF
ncbi:cytochrome P450 2E1-like [Pomacea canaliculata]|uniref:cytochrome P450 2E1-like n=1 Tax=Pomacea canaliculata TaxID=400727 RepID=UPI000D736667|nr:cytochrome P450 2E1-like [Pomacea canaliculata]